MVIKIVIVKTIAQFSKIVVIIENIGASLLVTRIYASRR